MRIILIAIAQIFFVTYGFSQSGKISGKVINETTGEPLVGATISLENPPKKVITDQSGVYTLSGLNTGKFTITVSFVGFTSKEISDINVLNDQVTDLSVSLSLLQENTLDNVVVKSAARRENQATLLIAQKNAAVVSDGISAELIKKTPDRNTSDVLKRISGVSIQDNKFAVVRGLNDRYNAAYLNGAPLPSSENDRKAFAFDIFPANMLENLVILKTASPDLPGEFAGGVINISTSSIPSKTATSISIGGSYNTIATFNDRLTYKGGKSDWLGLDDGTRAIPKGMPNTESFSNSNSDTKLALAKLYTNNNWGLISKNTLPSLSLQLTQSLNVRKRGADFFGMLLSLTYAKSFSFSDGSLNSYDYNRANPGAPPQLISSFNDAKVYSESTLAGAVANFSLKLNNLNRINLKSILSINSDDRVLVMDGVPNVSDPENRVNARALWFTSNLINSTQLSGEHTIGDAKIKVNWLLGYGLVDRKIPDLRQLHYAYSDGQSNYTAGIVSSTISSDNSGGRFYSNTDENIYSAKLDLAKSLDKNKNFTTTIKLGGYYQYRDRAFDARLFGFSRPTGGFDNNLLFEPQETIFDPSHLGLLSSGKKGFGLLEGTNPTFAYDANSTLFAAYLMADSRFGSKFRAIYGVRLENFNQKLNSFKDFTTPINIDTKKTDFLPSVNLVYSINTKQNIRLSYSKTLNRPEFRELAPFAFFDFSNRVTVGGNPSLVRASIDNFDLRYEIYPGRGQMASVSLFYKDFKNPIELTSDPNNFGSVAYQNAINGNSYGVELEFRTLLSTLFGKQDNEILSRFTIAANGSLIFSNVKEAPFAGVVKGVENRPLQGQSPYLFNFSAAYDDNDHGWSATISGNRVGQRIFIVGSVNEPDTWENGRTILDFQLAKMLLDNRLEIKMNYRDMLRQKQVFFLDLNENKRYDKSNDLIFQTRTFGSVISLSVSYKF